MHRRLKYVAVIVALCVLTATVSGCNSTKADELYRLPLASEEYLQLQEQIDAVLDADAEYAAPLSGPNRQVVQLKDIDGDGDNEAIAFFRVAGDKPLKIHIIKQIGDAYETVDIIEGDGSAIDSIRYADLNGDGVSELIVGWQMSSALLHMMIYSIRDNQNVLLAESDYYKLATTDMDGDGITDVVVLRLPSSEDPGGAFLFTMRTDGEIPMPTPARLSTGLESISHIQKGELSDGTTALFVEGAFTGSRVITDVFVCVDKSLVNIFDATAEGYTAETVRSQAVYSADINNDGIMEVPVSRPLDSQSEQAYYVVDWSAYNSAGGATPVFTTYHNFSDKWYLVLPDDWKDRVTVRRDDTVSGERTIIFSWLPDGDEPQADFLKIYALSGDNRVDRARAGNRNPMAVNADYNYAYEILGAADEQTISASVVTDGFKLIYTDWNTGVY